MEKISIIVPIYNVAPYLPACLDSIIHQTYLNLEIILVDDGSTDSSNKICEQYKTVDPRIQVIHQENQGDVIYPKRSREEDRTVIELCAEDGRPYAVVELK